MCVQVEKEEIESLIPKGVSELTKQQIRYLLQVRAYGHIVNVCPAHSHSAPPTSQNTPPSDASPALDDSFMSLSQEHMSLQAQRSLTVILFISQGSMIKVDVLREFF